MFRMRLTHVVKGWEGLIKCSKFNSTRFKPSTKGKGKLSTMRK